MTNYDAPDTTPIQSSPRQQIALYIRNSGLGEARDAAHRIGDKIEAAALEKAANGEITGAEYDAIVAKLNQAHANMNMACEAVAATALGL